MNRDQQKAITTAHTSLGQGQKCNAKKKTVRVCEGENCILIVQSVEHVRKFINFFVDGLILLLKMMDRSYIIHLPQLDLSTSPSSLVFVILL